MSDDLPMGWELVGFPEVVFFQEGPGLRKYQYHESGVPFLNIRTFVDERIDKKLCNYLDLEEVEQKYKHFLVDANDILVATSGSIGKMAIAKSQDLPLMLNTSIMRFRPITEERLERGFLYFFLKSDHFFMQAESAWTGTAQKNMGPSHIKTFNIFLPPLNEQRRIVDKLDRIGDRNRTARNELNHIPKLIARYKQAVLAAAFRGDLTADWRENPEIKNGELWSIPIDWNWKQIKDIAEIASNLVQTSEVMDLPHIAPNHIESGIPRLLPFKTVREDNVISAKHRFFGGQIIYSKIRPYLRKAVIVDFEGVCSADMYPINARCNSKYLLYWLISEDFNNLAVEHQGRTVLPKINQVGLYKLPIPVPSELEQKEIVRRVEKMFEKIDRMEQEYQKAAKLCDRLEQATLAKAFRGELVPQDPDDEPASVLLEQVKSQKEKGKKGVKLNTSD